MREYLYLNFGCIPITMYCKYIFLVFHLVIDHTGASFMPIGNCTVFYKFNLQFFTVSLHKNIELTVAVTIANKSL